MPTKDPARAAIYNRRYYLRGGAEKIKAAKRAAVQRNTEFIRAAKDVPCTDCGARLPFYVMDFDHVGEDKDATISRLVANGVSIARLEAEIAKCEVVCSNCHRERTWIRSRLARLR